MQCGHCGTVINEGFSTCPACGAVYQKRVGCIAGSLRYIGVSFLLFGAFGYFADIKQPPLPIGNISIAPLAVWLGAGIGCLVLHRILVSLTPYRWYR
jgi:hypothetical protein